MELIKYCFRKKSLSDNYFLMLWVSSSYLLIVVYFNCPSLSVPWDFMGGAFIIIQIIELGHCYFNFIHSFILIVPFWFKHKLLNRNNNPFTCFIESIFCYFSQLYFSSTFVILYKLHKLSDVWSCLWNQDNDWACLIESWWGLDDTICVNSLNIVSSIVKCSDHT